MYEKPQYLTPDGYRRTGKNPFKSGIPYKEAVQRFANNPNSSPDAASKNDSTNKKVELDKIKPHIAHYLKLKQNVEVKGNSPISDKAAKLIALAIKNLLKS